MAKVSLPRSRHSASPAADWALITESHSTLAMPGKLNPNLTVTYGLRYVRDSGRTDSDLAPIAALDQFDNQFYQNLGARVNQPNHNFAPQVGFAWDTSHKGTTVVRGGIGLFYENSIWNNNLFDRPGRLPTGLFLAQQAACSGGTGQ